MKKLLFTLTVLTILFTGCKKDDPEPEAPASVEIGTQIWTSVNYKQGDKELFTFEEAKAITPPDGFRLPNKDDWAKLFVSVGYIGGWHSSTAHSGNNVTVKAISMEDDFNIVKSLCTSINWGGSNTIGTNTTQFNAAPLQGNEYVLFHVSNSIFSFVEIGSAGFYLVTFDKDIRIYNDHYDDDKFAIRFVKDK